MSSGKTQTLHETESGIVVITEEDPDPVVVQKIVRYLGKHPHEHTVQEIAEALEVHTAQVTRILDSYTPARGGAKLVGEGKGGGWLPEEIAAQYRSTVTPEEDKG